MKYKKISDFPLTQADSAEVLGLGGSQNVRIEVLSREATEKAISNINVHNKGYYTSVEALNMAYPSANVGDRAYVGTSSPYAIYECREGAWHDTGLVGGNDVILSVANTADTTTYKDVF